VTVDAEDVETCSGPEAGDALSHASFGEHGTREFFTHVRFHKHDEDRIVWGRQGVPAVSGDSPDGSSARTAGVGEGGSGS